MNENEWLEVVQVTLAVVGLAINIASTAATDLYRRLLPRTTSPLIRTITTDRLTIEVLLLIGQAVLVTVGGYSLWGSNPITIETVGFSGRLALTVVMSSIAVVLIVQQRRITP